MWRKGEAKGMQKGTHFCWCQKYEIVYAMLGFGNFKKFHWKWAYTCPWVYACPCVTTFERKMFQKDFVWFREKWVHARLYSENISTKVDLLNVHYWIMEIWCILAMYIFQHACAHGVRVHNDKILWRGVTGLYSPVLLEAPRRLVYLHRFKTWNNLCVLLE